MQQKILVIILIILSLPLWLLGMVYEVGQNRTYQNIGDVPWESLAAGDSVKIYWRNTPYKEKWVICLQGTQTAPIVITGVPNTIGALPIIDGQGATTRQQLNFWNEERGIIKIGGANTPADKMPKYIIVENLNIKNGRPPYAFTGRNGLGSYKKNAAAVYIEKGEDITIRNCILHDCGNGLFAGGGQRILVEGCYYYDNGNVGSIYEHNNYTEVMGITFQFNRFGPLRRDCPGNNLKDRSGGCVIRYNWIESGNRQLDLVDAGDSLIINNSAYRETYVYGNIVIEPDGAGNSQICHYGGDSADESRYRKGILYFYNNTVISTRTGNTTLFRLSSNGETADARNNIIFTTAAGNRLAVSAGSGTIKLLHNWIKKGWTNSHSTQTGSIIDSTGNLAGDLPGFRNFSNQEFLLTSGSPCSNTGTSIPAAGITFYKVSYEYVKHQASQQRYKDGSLDLGAHEYMTTPIVVPYIIADKDMVDIFPNPAKNSITIIFSNLKSYSGLQSPFNMKLYSLQGKLLFSRQQSDFGKDIKLDLEKIAHNSQNIIHGHTVLSIKTDRGEIIKKITLLSN